ncbi:MAG: HAD-IA family hydrolase [Longimicrobiales bacterium]|jgi:pyrophosphatase PpaX|nr:HAD-IA family hydrolase [Longimicrobiales bacterium]
MSWRGVLFDLDGTLADTLDLILQSFRYTMRQHLGSDPSTDAFLASMGKPLPIQLYDYARSETERLAMRDTYVAYQRRIHDEMVTSFPGAVSVVRTLRQRGTRVGIVTSKGHRIGRRTIEVCGLHDDIEHVVFGDQVEQPKPHPEPVLKALDALSLSDDPGSVLFVGDSPHDVRAGRLAGTKTAAVGWGPIDRRVLEAEQPDFFVHDLKDVLAVTPSG